MALMTGPISPYITPDQLQAFPLGISWSTIPDQRATPAQQYAAQMLMCQTATGMVDTRCNQVLRSTQQTEMLRGPGSYRVTRGRDGTTRLLLSQRPVTGITQIQVAPAIPLPYQWQSVATGNWTVGIPPLLTTSSSVAADSGMGGQWVLLGPCQINGGGTWAINTTYTAGWPHAGITQNVAAGAEVLYVDDCTGWAPQAPGDSPAAGVIQDTVAGMQEAITCVASSAATGPGELILSTPLQFPHDAGILVTCLPNQVQWAAALYAGSQALARGSTATTIQSARGGASKTTSGSEGLRQQADSLLSPFKVIK